MNFAKSDAETKRELNNRTPDEWLEHIMRFRGNVRTRLAGIVWWDFYGNREAKHRWDNLDPFLAAPYIECDSHRLRECLIQIGYSEYMAVNRTQNPYERKWKANDLAQKRIITPQSKNQA